MNDRKVSEQPSPGVGVGAGTLLDHTLKKSKVISPINQPKGTDENTNTRELLQYFMVPNTFLSLR